MPNEMWAIDDEPDSVDCFATIEEMADSTTLPSPAASSLAVYTLSLVTSRVVKWLS